MFTILHKRGATKDVAKLTLEEGEIALAYNDDKSKVELYAGDGKGNLLLINSDVSELNNKFGFIKSLTADDDLNELGWSTGWFRIVLTVPADKNYPCNSGNMFIGTLEAYDVEDGKIQVLKSVLHNKIWYRTMQRIWTEPIQEVWKEWQQVISSNDFSGISNKRISVPTMGWYRIAIIDFHVAESASAIVEIGKGWWNNANDGVLFAITTQHNQAPNITQLTRGKMINGFSKCRLLVKGNNDAKYLEIYANYNNNDDLSCNIYGLQNMITPITPTLTESIPGGYTAYTFYFSDSGIKTDVVRAENLYGTVVNSSGADGAELMEWADGNPDNEDRCGYFVTFAGRKIRIANSSDDLRKVSAISGNYSFLGNDYADSWHSKYKKDVYGRRITKNVVHPAVTDDKGNVISEEYTTKEYILNDDYDENMEYIPRSERPEWDAVICYGQVVVRDDGTCIPDGFCKPNDEGKATYANDGFYVMDRVDEGNILIKI